MDRSKSNGQDFSSPDTLLVKIQNRSGKRVNPSTLPFDFGDELVQKEHDTEQNSLSPLKRVPFPFPDVAPNQSPKDKPRLLINSPIIDNVQKGLGSPDDKKKFESLDDLNATGQYLQRKRLEPALQEIKVTNLKSTQCAELTLQTDKIQQLFFAENTENEDQDIRDSKQAILEIAQQQASPIKKQEIRIVQSRQEYLKGNKVYGLKAQLSRFLPSKQTLNMVLAKSSNALSFLWPEFQLRFADDTRPLMAAKRTSFKPYSTYLISTTPNDYDVGSSTFLGKIKANLHGTVVNIFGPGLSPSVAAKQHQIPREILATIVYGQVEAEAPRRFSLFVKKEEYHYYLAFPQIKLYGPEVPLHELYRDPAARDKISVFSNRMPIYDPQKKSYVLNFHGKVECPSIRNFILEDESGAEIVLMGKSRQNRFNLEISSPLSPLIGFAMALSSFDPLWF